MKLSSFAKISAFVMVAGLASCTTDKTEPAKAEASEPAVSMEKADTVEELTGPAATIKEAIKDSAEKAAEEPKKDAKAEPTKPAQNSHIKTNSNGVHVIKHGSDNQSSVEAQKAEKTKAKLQEMEK